MPSDYDAISKSNEEMLGKDTASRKTQVAMYSDFTHFVFEILQNADDYDATEIEFRLMPDRLEIDHNGIPFCSENVKAISYFEKSTSREDLVKTGHFGLGFKSVFAFTATPIIHSGDESFQIYDLYRLREVPCPKDLREGQTRIVLPFNHFEDCPNFIEHYMPAEAAYEKIARRLKALDMISLLFTRRLTEIRWETSDQKGDYLREDSEVFDRHPLLKTRRTTITDGTALAVFI